ncbi:hypothetical protein DVH05_028127 [Phytophthora capsici]|nr:hypothetical protein DVH05_028127 [Phytophthora capsici]
MLLFMATSYLGATAYVRASARVCCLPDAYLQVEGHVDRIAVAQTHRRQGVGRRLLQAAIATLQTNRALKLVLEADTVNVGAIALYESQGFERTTVRVDYYKPGRDALLLELQL